MDLLQLKYFRTVAQTENITQAAHLLHISQPSLSQVIKRLETELGYPLFTRQGRNIFLNPSGAILLRHANDIAASLESMQSELNTQNQMESHFLRLSIGCASMLIPKLLVQLKAKYPDIEFQLCQQGTADSMTSYDLRIEAYPAPSPALSDSLLLREKIVLAIPDSFPLAAKKKIKTTDLLSSTFISLGQNWELTQCIDYFCKQSDFSPDISMSVDNPQLLRELLHDGLGLAFVPATSWGNLQKHHVIFRPLTDLPMERNIYLRQNPARCHETFLRDCVQIITQYFSSVASTCKQSSD